MNESSLVMNVTGVPSDLSSGIPTTTPTTTSTIGSTLSSIIANGGSHLKFTEDGLREPPLFTAPANLVIIVVGLSILIVPVICVFIAICARTRVFLKLKDMKLSSGGSDDEDESKLPYSQFDNSSTSSTSHKPRNLKISSDVRVLIENDNVTSGSPSREEVPRMENRVLIRSSQSADVLADEFQSADATFVVPGSNSNRSPAILTLDD